MRIREGVTEGELVDSADSPAPATSSLLELREAARHCKACHLWKTGTQTVFGAGTKTPR